MKWGAINYYYYYCYYYYYKRARVCLRSSKTVGYVCVIFPKLFMEYVCNAMFTYGSGLGFLE